jgi:hypothetical protein
MGASLGCIPTGNTPDHGVRESDYQRRINDPRKLSKDAENCRDKKLNSQGTSDPLNEEASLEDQGSLLKGSDSQRQDETLSVEVDMTGVSIGFLQSFVEKNRAAFANMSTSDVCRRFIQHDTAQDKISYVKWLEKDGNRESIGLATHFISHAWSYDFLSFVDILFATCKRGKISDTCYVWIDIFSVCQHTQISSFEHWAKSYQKAIRSIPNSWIVFTSIRPEWLRRSWCLFEFWCMIDAGKPLRILLSDDNMKAIVMLARGDDFEITIRDIVAQIDLTQSKAEAANQSDRDNIKQIVEDAIGFELLNEKMRTILRTSLADEMRRILWIALAEMQAQKEAAETKLAEELEKRKQVEKGALTNDERERIIAAAMREKAVDETTRLFEKAYDLKTGRHV